MVLALQSTTLDINTNVEAGLKIMNGLSWNLVDDGYLGIRKHIELLALVLVCSSGFGLDRWELMNLFLSKGCFGQ